MHQMAKEILIIQNVARENAGLFEEVLKENKIKYTVTDINLEERILPADNYGAVIIMGGPDSANDTNPKTFRELELIRNVIAKRIPFLGICLGMQMLVKAAGGQVVKSPVKEIGFRNTAGEHFKVGLTDAGSQDLLFTGMERSFNVFHLHGETVVLPENVLLLATGKECRNQIVKTGSNAYGIQCHFELSSDLFEIWMKEDPDLLNADQLQIRSDFGNLKDNYTLTGRKLFNNFLKLAGYQ
jgi:GMP synthase (glutamine-hydrolysing)